MAAGAIAAGVIGGAMAAGGVGAAIRAQRIKTKPKGVQYGGSADTRDALLDDYEGQAAAGRGITQTGVSGLDSSRQAATDLAGRGRSVMDSAGQVQVVPTANRAMSILDAYKPGAVAEAQMRETLDANAQANLGAARSGGALALRNALTANAGAGVQAAQGLAVQRAQEEQALLGAKVGQTNTDRSAMMDALQLAEQQRLQRLQTGASISQGGTGQALSAASDIAQVGQGQQQLYTNQTTNIYDAQTQLNADYEKRRQAEAQRKSNNIWNLGSSLITGGAKIAASGIG